MAFSLHLRNGCDGGPLVECSFDFSTGTARIKYVVRRATSASYSYGSSGLQNSIALTGNGAVGFIPVSSQTVTFTAKGCGCNSVCVIPPCCVGKDYLRLSFSGMGDVGFHFERTLSAPDFGDRTVFGSWDTSISGLGALNGTWLLPVSSGDQCITPPIDTGIDIVWACRWYSHGARYVSTRQITGETWRQDLTGTVTFRLWLHNAAVYVTGDPGTMVGTAVKTAGLSAGYNYTFDSIWTPKITAGTFQVYDPLIYAGKGIVDQFSASTGASGIGVGTTSLLDFHVASCGQRKSGPVLLTQYVGGSHWVLGEGLQPAYHHSRTGPTSWPGPVSVGTVEAEYIDVP